MRGRLSALAILFLLAHLFCLPPTLEDIDSVNFALGVRDFDVARHQPHPPGYPVFIGIGKLSTAVTTALGVSGAPSKALAIPGLIAGAVAVPLLFGLFRRLGGDDTVGWSAAALTLCSPLFWFTASRPLSDVTGLALALASQLLLVRTCLRETPSSGRRHLLAGAALCGLAAGVRVQTAMLTAPLLLAALAWPRTGLSAGTRLIAVGAAFAGVVTWAAPLLAASGGLGGYLSALGSQAGEDFSGVVMLWTVREARVAVDAVLNTFVWPWRDWWLGTIVLAAGATGALRLAWRLPSRFVLFLVAFVPYAVFHLLFHETVTMRYALPLVPAVAFLAACGLGALGRRPAAALATVLIVVSLARTVPAAWAYGREGSPAFRAYESIATIGSEAAVLGMHASMRRVEEWNAVAPDREPRRFARVLRGPHGHEWLALVDLWRREPEASVRFLADPRRTDLVLFDPQARRALAAARWSLPEIPFVAGTRPGAADAFELSPPGWMLDRGWALTAEIGGVTERDAAGPHLQPSLAWVRARPGPAELIIGGRHLGAAGDPPARITLSSGRGPIDGWDVAPGFFFRRVALAPGALAGTGYLPMSVTSVASDGSGRMVRVSLEQFDLQPEGTSLLGLTEGWHEPEYSPRTSRAWRWMSERAHLWVRPIGRDIVLLMSGESPMTYFERPTNVRVSAGSETVAQFALASDFAVRIRIPALALASASGSVTIETDQWFSPADRGAPDRRHLALRIYSIAVE